MPKLKKIYLLLFLIPNLLLAETIDNPPCLQTLICNVNGAFLKDNKDNRACVKELIKTQTNNNEQESDTPLASCLAQTTMDNNPKIDYTFGRIDPLPPRYELPVEKKVFNLYINQWDVSKSPYINNKLIIKKETNKQKIYR